VDVPPEDMEYLDFYQDKPFVLLNQKLIQHIHFDEVKRTCLIGVGHTLRSVNEYLSQF
jgi:hypothetical protein